MISRNAAKLLEPADERAAAAAPGGARMPAFAVSPSAQ